MAIREEGFSERLPRRDSGLGALVEQLLHKVEDAGVYVLALVAVEKNPHYFLVEEVDGLDFEGQLADYELVGDDPQRVGVAGLGVLLVLLQGHDLGRDVAHRAALVVQVLRVAPGGQPEVRDNPSVLFLPQYHVLWLDVPVHDVVFVEVSQSLQNVPNHALYQLPAKVSLVFERVVQSAP